MLSGQWLWLHDFPKDYPVFVFWNSLYSVLLYLFYLKMEASLLEMFFLWNVFDFLMILSNLALNEMVERYMILFILNLHSFCSICEVQVNWSRTLGGQLVTTSFCNSLIREKTSMREGEKPRKKEFLGLSRIKQGASSSIFTFPFDFFFFHKWNNHSHKLFLCQNVNCRKSILKNGKVCMCGICTFVPTATWSGDFRVGRFMSSCSGFWMQNLERKNHLYKEQHKRLRFIWHTEKYILIFDILGSLGKGRGVSLSL